MTVTLLHKIVSQKYLKINLFCKICIKRRENFSKFDFLLLEMGYCQKVHLLTMCVLKKYKKFVYFVEGGCSSIFGKLKYYEKKGGITMKVKKFLLTLFACISIIVFGAISASADTYGKYETLDYRISNNKVMITRCDQEVTEVAIPEQIEGYPVTSIGSRAFSHCKKLTNITIPDSVIKIYSSAFQYCTALTSIAIPDSVKIIESYAFAYCDKLESVVMGNDVEEVGGFIFQKCYSISSVVVPKNAQKISDSVLANTYSETLLLYYNGTEDEFKQSPWRSRKMNRKVKYFSYVTIIDTVKNQKIKRMYDINSSLYVADIKEMFGQYIPVLYTDENCENEFDLSTILTKNVVLYAKSQTSTACVTASTGEKIFITTPYLPENCLVILACYKDGKFVEMKSETNKNESIYFVVNSDFDSAKIMAWKSLDSMTPICDMESVR